jgi:hypothetical protein
MENHSDKEKIEKIIRVLANCNNYNHFLIILNWIKHIPFRETENRLIALNLYYYSIRRKKGMQLIPEI